MLSRICLPALLALTLLFGSARLIASQACQAAPLEFSDQFEPNLQSIGNVDAAVALVRQNAADSRPTTLADSTDSFVRKRFAHGYSEFKPCEDWIAYLAGFIRDDLRNPVLPDDILQHRRAACSQQAIVFQAVATRLGLDVASIRMRGHFMPAVRIGGQWIVYDPNREIEPRSYPVATLLSNAPLIQQRYGDFGRELGLIEQAAAGEIRVTDINSNPAPRASIFHRLTGFLSHNGWAVFLCLLVIITVVNLGRRHRGAHESSN